MSDVGTDYTKLAYQVRDIVNSHTPDRLVLKQVEENRESGAGRVLFLDTKAPTEFWSGIDGAYMVVNWHDDTTVEDVVDIILNGGPEKIMEVSKDEQDS